MKHSFPFIVLFLSLGAFAGVPSTNPSTLPSRASTKPLKAATNPSRASLRSDAPNPVKVVWAERAKVRAAELKAENAKLDDLRKQFRKASVAQQEALVADIKAENEQIKQIQADICPLPKLQTLAISQDSIGIVTHAKVVKLYPDGSAVVSLIGHTLRRSALDNSFDNNVQLRAAGENAAQGVYDPRYYEETVKFLYVTGFDTKDWKEGKTADTEGLRVWVDGTKSLPMSDGSSKTILSAKPFDVSPFIDWK